MTILAEFTFRDGKGRQLAGVNSEVTIENPTMIRVYRDEISRHLIDEGKRLHSEAISFHFESPITSVDFEKRVAQISGTQEVIISEHLPMIYYIDSLKDSDRSLTDTSPLTVIYIDLI